MAKFNKKILLVEDNPLNQHLTVCILGRQGIKADIAENGKIGYELFMKNKYEIVLMDIQMPVMDGIEATRLIREFESTNDGKRSTIIAVTAFAHETDKDTLFDAGMDHFLDKPLNPDDLIRLINTVN
ncbi:MAG: response regulator [Bacteroidales bacterium]|nr:response regulator [Bacteroidales bacterium]MCF8403747.1 response regulator [Bacteroidales bacterium]